MDAGTHTDKLKDQQLSDKNKIEELWDNVDSIFYKTLNYLVIKVTLDKELNMIGFVVIGK